MASSHKLFTFGVISDTHFRDPAGDTSSPFPVNACANERAFKAYGQLKEHAPAFIVHLGDMVHPLPHMSAYEPATAAARALFDSAQVPVHYVAGNHDVGDKPMPGSPAAVISDE
ncbi:MAG: putative phosphodiesterase, partial [Flavobacteriaceae bacterium]